MTKRLFFHASPADISIGDALKTPNGTSCMDVTSGGVVYMADNAEACKRYGGNVYIVEAVGAVSYKSQREAQGLPSKKSRYTRGVFVALPENTRIIGVL